MKHHILILFTADSLSDKSFFLKLWVKMLLANHFENFLKCNISRKTFLVFCIKISIEVSLKQIPSFFGGHSHACPKYPKQQAFAIFLQYLKKKGRHEVDFLHPDKQTFYVILSILVSMASHTQSTQNNKFAKSLLYLKKELRHKVDFCTDKHQSIQKVGTIIPDGCSQACLKYAK